MGSVVEAQRDQEDEDAEEREDGQDDGVGGEGGGGVVCFGDGGVFDVGVVVHD